MGHNTYNKYFYKSHNWFLQTQSTSDYPKGRKSCTESLAETSFGVMKIFQFSSVQSLSRVQLFANPWTAVCQASLSITNFWSLLKLMSKESVMPSNHLILCVPLYSCLQSFPASWSFPMSQFYANVLEFQLQHQSFQ